MADLVIDLTLDPKWVRRALEYFDALDTAKTGIVTLDQIVLTSESLKEICNASEAEVDALKNAQRLAYGDAGFTSSGMKREDFPSYFNTFAQKEKIRKQNNQQTYYSTLMNAIFVIIDTNQDGVVSLDELEVYMIALGTHKDAAIPFLLMADTNKNGTVEREELADIESRFWFEPIDDKIDNLYGGLYSGNFA